MTRSRLVLLFLTKQSWLKGHSRHRVCGVKSLFQLKHIDADVTFCGQQGVINTGSDSGQGGSFIPAA